MADQVLTLKVPFRKAFNLIPGLAKQAIELTPLAAELATQMAGTEIGVLLEVDGEKYGLLVKNGKDFQVANSIDKPLVKATASLKDIEKTLDFDNVEMIINQFTGGAGTGSKVNKPQRSKYDILKSIKGSVTARLTHDDGCETSVKVTFNETEQPSAIVSLKMSDVKAIIAKESNPMSLVMSGKIKMEGDMGILMALQPLQT